MKQPKIADFVFSYELRNSPFNNDQAFFEAQEIEDMISPVLMILCPDIKIIENILEVEINTYAQKGKAYIIENTIILSPCEYADLKKRFRRLSKEFCKSYGNPHSGRNYS